MLEGDFIAVCANGPEGVVLGRRLGSVFEAVDLCGPFCGFWNPDFEPLD